MKITKLDIKDHVLTVLVVKCWDAQPVGVVEAGEVSFLRNGLENHLSGRARTCCKAEDQPGWVLLLPGVSLIQRTVWECWYVANTFLINKA